MRKGTLAPTCSQHSHRHHCCCHHRTLQTLSLCRLHKLEQLAVHNPTQFDHQPNRSSAKLSFLRDSNLDTKEDKQIDRISYLMKYQCLARFKVSVGF